MNAKTDAQDQSQQPHVDDAPRLDSIRADRACIKCGFNLFGQEVTKEPHYQLAIARCPECGTVAALQTYPTMSHWANRFRMLIAAVWIFSLIAIFFIQMSMVGSFSDGISRDASGKFAKEIGQQYETWAQENGVTIANPFGGTGTNQYPQWNDIPNDWAKDHVDQIYHQMGGHFSRMLNELVWSFIPASIIAFMFGIFWSNALLGASCKKAAVVPVMTGVIAVVLMYFPDLHWGLFTISHQAQEIAKEYYSVYLAFFGVFIQLPALILGVWLGRKIARWVITLTLPPRARVPFSIFWTRDGLGLPKP